MNSSASRALVAERTRAIVNLHLAVEASLRRSVQDAIKIGELLAQQKDELPHGDFLAWIERELPFTDRTARRYMLLWEYRSKTDTVSDLTEAHKIAQIEDQRQRLPAKPVDPEIVERQRKKAEEFARKVREAPAEPSKPRVDYQPLIDESREYVDRAREALRRDASGDTDPEQIIAEIFAFNEAQLTRTKESGVHMVVNANVKFWREKSIDLNRKAVKA
jgi:hypothetical protein